MTVYLDHHATTPCDPAVVDAMLPYFTRHFGNAGTKHHRLGARAHAAVTVAREQVAAALGGDPAGVVFTSGATESDNLALLGAARALGGRRKHLVTVGTEHKAVLAPLRHLAAHEGFRLTELPVGPDGALDLDTFDAALSDDTLLVSFMAVNNETGHLHPVGQLAERAHARGALVHVDAAQGLGRIPLDVGTLGLDLVSISGHKVYGPKGIGALYVRPGRPRIDLAPLQLGGGQEGGLRPGTQPVPLMVALGVAATRAVEALEQGEMERQAQLRDRLWQGLSELGGVHLHGSWEHRVANNLNLRVDGVPAREVLTKVRGVAFSSGSACASANPKPSHVLTAMGLSPAEAKGALRFGLGQGTTAEDIDTALDLIRPVIRAVRDQSSV